MSEEEEEADPAVPFMELTLGRTLSSLGCGWTLKRKEACKENFNNLADLQLQHMGCLSNNKHLCMDLHQQDYHHEQHMSRCNEAEGWLASFEKEKRQRQP